MALIPQQDIVTVMGKVDELGDLMKKALEAYPEVKIVSLSHHYAGGGPFNTMIAVVETV